MTKFIKFLGDDAGAVTVDWVALTAGILLLGIVVVYVIFNGGVSTVMAGIDATLVGASTNVSIGPAPKF